MTGDLTQFPERGSHPEELLGPGIREFRQTSFKPYRVIYRIIGTRVIVYLMDDDRREMQSAQSRRVLGG